MFKNKKIKVDYHDNYFPNIPKMRNYNFNMKSINLNAKSLKKYTATVILTDHDYIDYRLVKKNSKIIFDSRGRFENSKNIINV